MHFKKIMATSLLVTSALVTVVPLGGHDEVNQITSTVTQAQNVEAKEVPIKEEVLVGIDKVPTVTNKNKKDSKKVKEEKKKEDVSSIVETPKYTNTTVNLRKSNSVSSDILTTLKPNVMVVEYKIKNGWSYVALDEDTYGYIKSEYLSDEETPISKLNRWGITLSKDEIDLLAKILFLEANLEPYNGQVAVVETIFNRMIDGYWGDSLYDVLSASGQFVTWKNRNIAKPTAENYRVIYDVLDGKTSVLGMDYLYFSRGGHRSHGGMIPINNHQFCKK